MRAIKTRRLGCDVVRCHRRIEHGDPNGVIGCGEIEFDLGATVFDRIRHEFGDDEGRGLRELGVTNGTEPLGDDGARSATAGGRRFEGDVLVRRHRPLS